MNSDLNNDVPDYVMVCTGPNCGERGGRELIKAWKDQLVDSGRWEQCRVVPALCFGQCATGPNACHLGSGRFETGVDPERPKEMLEQLTARTSQPAD